MKKQSELFILLFRGEINAYFGCREPHFYDFLSRFGVGFEVGFAQVVGKCAAGHLNKHYPLAGDFCLSCDDAGARVKRYGFGSYCNFVADAELRISCFIAVS